MQLNPILSTVTCTKATVGAKTTITIIKNKPTYTHKLEYTFKSFSGTIVDKYIGETYEWTIPTDFYNELGGHQARATIHCTTYDGVVVLGTTNYDLTIYANPYDTPTISAVIKDSNNTTVSLTGDSTKLIRYRSTAYITTNAEAKNSATVASQKATNASAYFTTPTGSFGNVESEIFKFQVTDSRGLATTVTIDLKRAGRWIEYTLPTCHISSSKPDASGNITLECYGVWWNQNFGAADNTISAQCRYKIDSESSQFSSWTNMTISKYSNEYTASVSISGLDYRSTYVFEARVIDKLTTTVSAEYKARALPVFSWSGEDFEFNVPVHFAAGTTGTTETDNNAGFVDGDFTIKGDLRLKKDDSNYGCTLRFGDDDNAYITEKTNNDITINATDVNIDGNVAINGNAIEAGDWTPELNSSAVSSYITQNGWYLRIGKNVSIGWYIKANINSGYHGTAIEIDGAPFVSGAVYRGAGGGMCANAYVSIGCVFQCYVMESSGKITVRVQKNYGTSNANLQTSASGCFYTQGGGELTLAGSMTYRII